MAAAVPIAVLAGVHLVAVAAAAATMATVADQRHGAGATGDTEQRCHGCHRSEATDAPLRLVGRLRLDGSGHLDAGRRGR
jgi:hypothetical protein